MKTNKFINAIIAMFFCIAMQSQNVGINNTGTAPDNSAQLDLNTGNTFGSGTSKGLIVPNVSLQSTTDAVTIPSPATSLLVYNTNTAMTGGAMGFYYNSGTPASPLWVWATYGQQFRTVWSTAQVTNLSNGSPYTPIPGCTQTITVPTTGIFD